MKDFLNQKLYLFSPLVLSLFEEQYKESSVSARKYFLFTLAIIGAYVATALLGFQFATINHNVTLIWIPAGIALAAVLHYGPRYWPAVFIGATIANIISGTGLFVSLSIAVGNTAEILIVYWILNYFFNSCLTCSLENPRHIFGFVVAVGFGALAASLNGSIVLALQVFNNWDQFYSTLSIWWFGDVMGMLLITPFTLIWLQPMERYSFRVILKNILLFGIVMLALLISFGGAIQPLEKLGYVSTQYPLDFIPMAALLITALFSGPRLVSLAIITSTVFIIVGTQSGYGPFVRSEFEESTILIYLFISISTICTYSLSYMLRQRNLAQEESRIGSERLEVVMESTEDGVWDWDVESDEVYISSTFKKMLGYDVADHLGNFEKWRSRIHPEDKQKTLNLLNDHYDGKSEVFQSEFRFLCKDGQYLWVLCRAKNVKRHENESGRHVVGTCVNLMTQKKKEAKLELASKVIQSTPEAVMVTSADNIIIDVNPAFTKTTGYELDEVMGRQPSFLSSGRHDKAFYQDMWANIEDNGYWQGEIWNRRKNGEIFPEWMHISAITSADERVVQYAAIFSDIGNQENLKKELHNFAYYDALTGLPNRDLLIDRLNITLHQVRKNDENLAILLIDLDRFKIINETLGHSVGDALLQEVSTILSSVIGEGDTVARMGGDEFVILLPHVSSMDEIGRVAENILEKFTQPYTIHEHELHITCSIGIAVSPQDGETAEELIKNADTSMYKAKEQGFNKYSFYHADMSAAFHESFLLESQLRYAIERDELFLQYQPQHDIHDGSIIGMEALLRWRHPDLGIVPPDKFISIAENTGLIIPIGEWVIKQAIKDTCTIRDRIRPDFRVAINISVMQLTQCDLVDLINSEVDKNCLPHHYLELEITESILMKNIDATLLALNSISALGVKIAIDDFGTGYSSLSYLKKFPISKLKIDKSFVDDVCISNDDAEIASTIIAMGHNLHMKVIAEGVEDADQQFFLQSKGCDEVQGYHYSRPLMLDQFIEYLSDQKFLNNMRLVESDKKQAHPDS